MKLLGDKIKEIRKRKNISQQELADKLFVSDKTISSWEKNRTEPNLDMIVKICDIWYIAIQYLLNSDDYKKKAVENQWFTASGKYFSTNAENAYRFIADENDFIESHTALSDARIEAKIFTKAVNHNKWNIGWGIQPFPYKILGTVENFIKESGV